jgi:lysophospholipase L1-like esterase
METLYEKVKSWVESHLKNSKYWPLTQNNGFFDNAIRYPKGIIGLAEGDSWFDYDYISKLIHFDGPDLIGHLCRDGEFNVLRLSFAGDTLAAMACEPQLSNVTEVMKLLRKLEGWIGDERFRPKFVMLSGGGNDMSGNHGKQLRNFLTAEGLNELRAFHSIDVDFRAHFETLIANVRSVDPTVPIFLHGYAYPVPDGRGVRNPHLPVEFDFEGPWLKPAFDFYAIPETERFRIMIRLIDRFNEMLMKLIADRAESDGHLHLIDLRDCFPKPPYPEYMEDWTNELHPTSDGFRRIAERFRDAIRSRLALA